MVTPDRLVRARPVPRLLVHLDRHRGAGGDGAFAGDAGAAADVAAEVGGGYVRDGGVGCGGPDAEGLVGGC
ncbi:hypothetical protein V500_10042 [Pseudogymnoascus sp. VKM F-4518 (FW-2643)]|nr:hypothetical protein V500_10042 [Pseudogymnoascus sp. VKM F-4518 (FW-2643)]